jgi:hypothetical protein
MDVAPYFCVFRAYVMQTKKRTGVHFGNDFPCPVVRDTNVSGSARSKYGQRPAIQRANKVVPLALRRAEAVFARFIGLTYGRTIVRGA